MSIYRIDKAIRPQYYRSNMSSLAIESSDPMGRSEAIMRLSVLELRALRGAIDAIPEFVKQNGGGKAVMDPKDGRQWLVVFGFGQEANSPRSFILTEAQGKETYVIRTEPGYIHSTDHYRGLKGTSDYQHFPETILEVGLQARFLLERLYPVETTGQVVNFPVAK